MKLDGTAGPIDATDAALTPMQAKVTVNNLDLAASGFVEPASGLGRNCRFQRHREFRWAAGAKQRHGQRRKTESFSQRFAGRAFGGSKIRDRVRTGEAGGQLTQGDVTIGKALAKLTGGYQMQGASTVLNMKLNAENMPVDDLVAMLPALGVILPSGSTLKGGTLTANFTIVGPGGQTGDQRAGENGEHEAGGLRPGIEDVGDFGADRGEDWVGYDHSESERGRACGAGRDQHAEREFEYSGAGRGYGKRDHQSAERAELQDGRQTQWRALSVG